MNELIRFLEEVRKFPIDNKRIIRDEDSRRERIYEYIEHTVSEDQVRIKRIEFVEIKLNEQPKGYLEIYAIDSSSRVIDTPYIFLAIGAATIINRIKGYILDYPNIYHVLNNYDLKYKYAVIIPEVSNYPLEILDKLERKGVTNKNPIGIQYTPKYSKYVVLDELRLGLENTILEKTLQESSIRDSYIFIDGPIYYTPPLVYQLNEFHGVKDELLNVYVESWKYLIEKRVNLIDKLYKERNIIVLGVVKRLYRSNILSRIDPLRVSNGNINDEAYLSIVSTIRYQELTPKPFYIGPIIYDPGRITIKLPSKKLYYIGLPRRQVAGRTDYRNYMFYRVETIHGDDESLNPIIYDSIYSGSILPLSILLADNRAKKITNGMLNYLLRITNLPTDHTYQYITF